jgi:hypothetical protein
MAIQESDTLAKLTANYNKIIAALPPDLSKEFQTRILTPSDIKEYARTITVALEFKNQTSMIRIENWMLDRFKIGNFGKKLKDKGFNPSDVYEHLLAGFFDYK